MYLDNDKYTFVKVPEEMWQFTEIPMTSTSLCTLFTDKVIYEIILI